MSFFQSQIKRSFLICYYFCVNLYLSLCGFPPFYDENDDLGRLYRKIKRADYDMPSPYWDNVSPSAKDLVKKLLQPDPKKRLTSTQTLKHPWLRGNAPDTVNKDQQFNLKRFQYVRILRVQLFSFQLVKFFEYFCCCFFREECVAF